MKKTDTIKNCLILLGIMAIAVVIYITCYGKGNGQLISIDINKPMDGFIEHFIQNDGVFQGNILSECDYNIQNIIMLLLGKVCANIWNGINVYYIFSFFMIAFSMYWCMQKFKISVPVSIAISVLTAFLPYHTDRGQGQLVTSNFFIVPLILGIWYDLFYEKNYSENKKINIFYMTIMCLAPFIDIRVSWMMIILTIILLINRSDMEVTKKVAVYLLPSIMLSVFAGVLTGIIGSGDLTEKIELAKTEGLRLLDMLMPVRYHIVGKLNDMRLNYDIGFSASGESGLNTMGLLFSIAFLTGIFTLFFIKKCDERIKWLSWISIIVIIISNIHGLNLLFEYIGLNILYWNRMGIFIIVVTVVTAAIVADYLKTFICKLIKGKKGIVLWYVIMCVAVVGTYMELLLRSNMP